jgi:arsenate reductase
MNTVLLHNPNCSKSRTAKTILEEKGVDFLIIDYIKEGLKEKLLSHLSEMANLPFEKMVRESEDVYKELGLKNKNLSENEWISVLMDHPVLLERPIFIHNNKAVIARPPERVLEIL